MGTPLICIVGTMFSTKYTIHIPFYSYNVGGKMANIADYIKLQVIMLMRSINGENPEKISHDFIVNKRSSVKMHC